MVKPWRRKAEVELEEGERKTEATYCDGRDGHERENGREARTGKKTLGQPSCTMASLQKECSLGAFLPVQTSLFNYPHPAGYSDFRLEKQMAAQLR